MLANTTDMSRRQAAILGGTGLIIMLLAVIVAFPNTLSLIVQGDPTKTVQQITEAGILYRIGIVGWMVVLACDILVSLAFYVYFKKVHQSYSLLTAWFRLFYTAIFAAMLVQMLVVLLLFNGAEYLTVFTKAQQHALVLLSLRIFEIGWLFGLGFFGIHLFGLGYLALKSDEVPKILGILLIVASVGYTSDTVAYIALPSYKQYEETIKMIIAFPNAAGELFFGFWLLFKGGKSRQSE